MARPRPMRNALHLDFHTLPEVTGIGEKFDPDEFGDGLLAAGIEYVNVFAKCNLGFAYYPTTIGTPHPHLTRDLLGGMVAACHSRDIGVTAYLSMGLDHEAVRRHREWAAVDAHGRVLQEDRSGNFFRLPCHRSGYADEFVGMVAEVVAAYDVDGIFCDNLVLSPCWGDECLTEIRDRGEDPTDPEAVRGQAERARLDWARRVKDAVGPDRYLIFNGVPYAAARELNTHMEVECLPAHWGYDFVEPTAALARTTYDEVLYMTGRFQASWGDFGGYKGLGSLRYDLADALALGIEFSVGDHQLPDGRVEPLVLADLARLHDESKDLRAAVAGQRHLADTVVVVPAADYGAGDVLRGLGEMFAELSLSYDVVTDAQLLPRDKPALLPYDLVVVPENTMVTPELASLLERHLAAGGAALVVGGQRLAGDWPLESSGDPLGERCYFRRTEPDPTSPEGQMHWSSYAAAVSAVANPGAHVVASLVRPWFENTYDGFHGHFYTPPADRVGDEVAAATSARRAQVAFAAFTGFHRSGSSALTELVGTLVETIQPDRLVRRGDVPAAVKLDLAAAPEGGPYRRLLHVRTGRATPRGAMDVVIDPGHLAAGHDVSVAGEFTSARLLPDGAEVTVRSADGRTTVTLPEVVGHAVVGLA